MTRIHRTYVLQITPALAEEWLENYRYEFQREPRTHIIQRYAKQMREGHWHAGTALKLGSVGEQGPWVLLDGQHRLRAVLESGIPQSFSITELICDTLEELGLVYATTDRAYSRTVADLYRTIQLNGELGLADSILNKAGSALQFVAFDFLYVSKPIEHPFRLDYEQLLSEIRYYRDAIEDYWEAVADAGSLYRKPLLRIATFGLGIVLYKHAKTTIGVGKIDEFWQGIARDDGLRKADPRKYAAFHLLTAKVVGATQRSGSLVSATYSARYLAQCWNAWVEGRVFSEGKGGGPKVINASGPIIINGTPWNGKQ